MLVLRSSLLTLVASALCVAVAAQPARAALPSRPAPAGLIATDEPGGGRILAGAMAATPSAGAELGAGIRLVRGYFDAPPVIRGAVRSRDGRVTIALFDATLARRAMRGLIVTTRQRGAGQVAYLFDERAHLDRTLGALERALPARQAAAVTPPSGATTPANVPGWGPAWTAALRSSARVSLSPRVFADRTAAIGLAPGFSPLLMQNGELAAKAPDGAFIRIGGFIPVIDPKVGAAYLGPAGARVVYTPDVAEMWLEVRRAFDAAKGAPDERLTVETASAVTVAAGKRSQTISGRGVASGGRAVVYHAIVSTSPPRDGTGAWSLQFAAFWSPAERLVDDGPALIAMGRSYSADTALINSNNDAFGAALARRQAAFTRASIASNTAWRERLERQSAESLRESVEAQTWISQQGASAIHIMKGENVVYQGPGTRHQIVPITATGNFVNVPIAEYQKGTDY